MVESIPINEIRISDRFRKNMGDISELARSIKEVGLLHPVVVSESKDLIAGYRRIQAYRLLGRDTIPVRVVSFSDLHRGEVVENTERKDFTVSEMVAVARFVSPGIEAEHPQGRPEENAGKFPDLMDHNRDRIAKYVGVSGRTLEKAKTVVEAAEKQPDLYQPILEKVDNGSISVDKAYKIVTIKEKQREIKESGSPPFPEGLYDVIYADPPWKYDYNGSLRGKADIHYSTMELKDILLLPIHDHIASDAILLLWTTNTFLEEALKVMHYWGFTYKTNFVWIKDRIGTGFWLRNQHELLLLGFRGDFPHPADEDRPSSVIQAPYMEHSAKPDLLYPLIEKMYPKRRYLELFARNQREGWTSWGFEA